MAAILVMCPESFEQIFIPLTHKAFTWNLALMDPEALEQKIFWKYKSEWPWMSLSIFPYKSIRKQI